MTTQEREFDPDWTIHPGVHWAEAIAESGRVQKSVAEEMGVSEKHLSQICNGAALPSAEATVAFSRALDLPIRLMWQLCSDYKLALALGKTDLTRDYFPSNEPSG